VVRVSISAYRREMGDIHERRFHGGNLHKVECFDAQQKRPNLDDAI
jgi:hypothetical protein